MKLFVTAAVLIFALVQLVSSHPISDRFAFDGRDRVVSTADSNADSKGLTDRALDEGITLAIDSEIADEVDIQRGKKPIKNKQSSVSGVFAVAEEDPLLSEKSKGEISETGEDEVGEESESAVSEYEIFEVSENKVPKDEMYVTRHDVTSKDNKDEISLENEDEVSVESEDAVTEESEDEVTEESEDEVTEESEDEVSEESEDEVSEESEDEVSEESEDEVFEESEDEVTEESDDEVSEESEDEVSDESEDEISEAGDSGRVDVSGCQLYGPPLSEFLVQFGNEYRSHVRSISVTCGECTKLLIAGKLKTNIKICAKGKNPCIAVSEGRSCSEKLTDLNIPLTFPVGNVTATLGIDIVVKKDGEVCLRTKHNMKKCSEAS